MRPYNRLKIIKQLSNECQLLDRCWVGGIKHGGPVGVESLAAAVSESEEETFTGEVIARESWVERARRPAATCPWGDSNTRPTV